MERIEETKQRKRTKSETRVSPLTLESRDLRSFLEKKAIENSPDLIEDLGEKLKLYSLSEHLYFMNVGRFVRRENEFRAKKENPSELILDFIASQKGGRAFQEKNKIQSVWKEKRKSKVRHVLTNPWGARLDEERSELSDESDH